MYKIFLGIFFVFRVKSIIYTIKVINVARVNN
jgi:hypothetical protein